MGLFQLNCDLESRFPPTSPPKHVTAALQVPPLDRCLVAAAALCRAGLVERVAFDNQARLRVMPARDADSNDLMRRWRDMAVEAWLTSGHPGWAIATEPMVRLCLLIY